ncbi:MAG TPA: N-acetylneuraminate synthase [Nitrospirae bacterium]|nr:N-acetylneuraminate synthase [Nitrospirota bacterium]
MKTFKIGSKYIGEGHPCYIVLEAGPTIDSIETALKLVDVAAESGADAIKFQIIDAERLMGNKDVDFTYKVLKDRETGEMETVTESLFGILRRRVLTTDEWRKIKARCDELNLTFFATIDFPEGVDLVAELGCHAIKIASGDVSHSYLISYAAATGIPIMLDTGSSTIGEIEKAVEVVKAKGNEKIIIHHCPSGYPARLESINLNTIKTLQHMFEFPIAFSDHTPGWDMDIAAVTLGVCMVEKTITLDKMTRSCEHVMSLEPHETKSFVNAIRDLVIALGTGRRIMGDKEAKDKLKARRSIFAKKHLSKGSVLEEESIDYCRPGTGIRTDETAYAFGRVLKKEVQRGEMIQWEDLD